MPAFVKFSVVLLAMTVATIGSYHLFMRFTAIGALLNGRRYPRALPQRAPVVEQVLV